MKKTIAWKMAVAGVLIAVCVVCSPLSIPVGASRCFPVQHLVNILAAVLLGPFYGVGMAFVTSLIRVLMGTGTLLAFPGSMCGALLCGLVYKYSKNIPFNVYRRAVRHISSGRNLRISNCGSAYGKRSGAVDVHTPVLCQLSRRNCDSRRNSFCAEKDKGVK